MGTMFKNLILHDYQEKSFYHALRTKGFVILAGLSGTGKTKIFEEFNISVYEYSDSLKEAIEQFKKTFESFLDRLDSDLDNPDYNEDYSLWKQALDNWTNVWQKGNKDSINIVSLLTNYKFTREQLEKNINDPDLRKLEVIAELATEFGITEEDLQPLRKAEDGKYYFEKPEVEVKSARDDNASWIRDINIKTIFPVLRDTMKEIKQGSSTKLGSKVVNFFKIILKDKGIFSGDELRSILPQDKIEKYFKQIVVTRKLFLPIRPDFKDSKSLLGYYNPLKGEYHTTELLDFILNAQREFVKEGKDASPYLVLFDEMNLARVEYYFADFLSVLESKRVEDISDVDKEMLENIKIVVNNYEDKDLEDRLIGFYSKPIILHNENLSDIPQKLYLPPNIYFIGSVNIDETTYMFSPKVLDRAFTIEFDADIELYLNKLHENNNQNTGNVKSINVNKKCYDLRDFTRKGQFAKIDKECVKEIGEKTLEFEINGNKISKRISDILKDIFSILQPYELHFGYRVYDEIMMFVYNANEFTRDEYKMNLNEALDLAIKMKILPKFHGARQKLEKPITKFIEYCMYLDQKNSDQNKEKKYLKPQSIPILKDGEIFLDDNKYSFKFPHTAKKLIEMLYKLQTQGFASFM